MSQSQTTYTNQSNTTTLPIDPTPLLQYGNSPTAIILSIAILLWVVRPVMQQQKANTADAQNQPTNFVKSAIAFLTQAFR